MSLKLFFFQLIVLMLSAWIFAWYFSADYSMECRSEGQSLRSEFAEEVAGISRKLDELERLLNRYRNTSPRDTVQTAPSEKKNKEERQKNYAELSRKLHDLEEREQEMENALTNIVNKQAELAQVQQKQLHPEPVRIRNWLARLPEEKKLQVQAAYMEQLEKQQDILAVLPDDRPPSPEEMREMLRQSRGELKERLRDILDEAEYQAFLDSLDADRPPLVLPPM